jgi:alpha-D-xyloside xylohydrolase
MAPNPFPQDIHWSFQPAGDFLSFDVGPLQARLHQESGHFALVGPDLANRPLANVIQFAPPAVHTSAGDFSIGKVISSKSLPNGLEAVQLLGARQITARITFPHEGVMRYEVTGWSGAGQLATAVAAVSSNAEHFYGYGEKFNSLDQAGKRVHTLTFDDPGVKGDHSYKVAPWFISTRGYGVHFDSPAECIFDMRASAPDRYVITNPLGTLAMNVAYGPLLTDVLGRFTGYTGRPPLPPPWALGPWISSDVWRSGGEVRYAVTQFRKRGIPVSAFVFDSPWETAYNDLNFNMTQFGNDATMENEHFDGFSSLAEMMTFLQTNGLKVICWMTPFINISSPDREVPGQNLGKASNYDEGSHGGFFVRSSADGEPLVVPWWKGHGSPVDFTHPAARQWFAGQLRRLISQSQVITASNGKEPAIGGFKTDDGESGNGPNTYIPRGAVYADGRTGIEMRNAYSVEYQKAISSVLGPDGVLFARSGFAGSQAFPGHWAGDNEPNFGENGLPGVIVAGQSAAMSGYSIWGHDVGGYQNHNFSPVSTADLFMRWSQFGCFSPIMQMHRQVSDRDLRQYPWGYSQPGETIDNNRALANYQFYATLHTRLFPYLYSYAKQSAESGLPIIRPLVLMHQDDPTTFGIQHVYYFGGDLLVAPIIEPTATEREVYLPEGEWIDFWTNERHTGKRNFVWRNPAQPDPPQSKMALFVRRGAIVPLMLGQDVQTLCDANYINNLAIKTWDGALEIRAYPAGNTRFTVFDGTEIDSAEGAGAVSVTIKSASARELLFRILALRPAAVRRNGTAMPEAASSADFEIASTAWRFDTTTGSVLVKFSHPGGTSTVTL